MRQSVTVLTFIALFLCTVGVMLPSSSLANANKLTVEDLAGRTVTFDRTPERIILGDSRYLNTLSVLFPEDPIQNVTAMLSNLQYIDFGTYMGYREAHPLIETIPIIGNTSADSFSVESAISLGADLAIFSLDGHGPNARNANIIQTLEKAGVNVLFIDFRQQPLKHTVQSMRLLGQVLGASDQAERFITFYEAELNKVLDGLSELNEAPQKVFIHSRVGVSNDCCETMVRGMMADFVVAAGGQNIAKPVVPGSAGIVNLEYLLTHQPDVYIATAVGSKDMPDEQGQMVELPYVMLGVGTPAMAAKQSLNTALEREHLIHLSAVKQGRAHAIWHGFYNSPLNIAAVQRIAKWLYPETFKSLNPEQTLATLFDEYQAINQTGVYWVTLDHRVQD